MRSLAVGSLIATILILGIWKVIPYLRQPGPATDSTPTFQPLSDYKVISLAKGQPLCIDQVTFTPNSRYAQFTLAGAPADAPNANVVASASGYSSAGSVPEEPGAQLLTVPIRPPARELTDGKVCITNLDPSSIDLIGVPPSRSTTESTTTINGKALSTDVSLTLLNKPGISRVRNLPETLTHAAALSPLAPWMIWVLMVVLLAGVPLALIGALSSSIGHASRARKTLNRP